MTPAETFGEAEDLLDDPLIALLDLPGNGWPDLAANGQMVDILVSGRAHPKSLSSAGDAIGLPPARRRCGSWV